MESKRRSYWSTGLVAAGLFLSLAWSTTAQAVPSFARQTGMACAACHTMFPELTAFGRQFKLDGYTLQATPQITGGDGKGPVTVQLSAIPPLSVMFQASYTDTKGADKVQQGTRDSLQFPEQFSLFYAGEISPHLGAFLQVTHSDNSSGFGMDNSEVRYADHVTGAGKDLLFGILANNNPGMSDVWQATPVWGYPFAGPLSYEAPLSSTLGGSVGGAGAYVLYDTSWYAELMMYKTMGAGGQDTGLADPWAALTTPPGGATPVEGVAGWAPYWKLAYQNTFGDNTIEVGLSGMQTRLYGTGTGTSGPTNSFKDVGIDFQYERPLGNDSIVVRGAFIKEKIVLDAYRGAVDPTQGDASFHVAKLNGSYHFGSDKSLSLGYVATSGDGTAPGAVTGTHALVVEGAYYPWENVRLSLQYTSYSKFAGVSDNASDNNTLYVLGWFVF